LILYRCFPWDERARTRSRGGPLWFPRELQGEGRHDNPAAFGCLYLTEREDAGVAEQLADFRGSRFGSFMLQRNGLPLGLAALELSADRELLDLDEPRVLSRERLRPSLVATRVRDVTQPQALVLFHEHPDVAGLRWWSTHEAQWINVTLFDRARTALRLKEVRRLVPEDPAVAAAAEFLGLAP
jgi:hypothetical protein